MVIQKYLKKLKNEVDTFKNSMRIFSKTDIHEVSVFNSSIDNNYKAAHKTQKLGFFFKYIGFFTFHAIFSYTTDSVMSNES